MNYTIEVLQPDGRIMFRGCIDLTPLGLTALKEQLRAIRVGHEQQVTELRCD